MLVQAHLGHQPNAIKTGSRDDNMITKLSSALGVIEAVVPRSGTATQAPQNGSAYAFSLTAINGLPMPLEQFRGKALLIVNTASRCGFSCQYKGLQQIWNRYQGSGLVVIGVPSNDFGRQEPKRESEIHHFCRNVYRVTFPLAEKTKVRGHNAHEFYRWAADTLGEVSRPRWNFHKYLINSDGRIVAWFSPSVLPRSSRLIEAIEGALPKLAPTGYPRIMK